MQTIKLKRVDSGVLEEVNQQQFYPALKNANTVDDIIRIGDIFYILSSLTMDDAGAGGSITTTIPVPAIEVRQLTPLPKLMLPAPGIGKFIQLIDVYAKNIFGTAPYNGIAPRLRYIGVSYVNDICQFDSTFLTTTQTIVRNGLLHLIVKNFIENAGIELGVSVLSSPSGGDGSFLITITYQIKDF